jgi:hypothetical protein
MNSVRVECLRIISLMKSLLEFLILSFFFRRFLRMTVDLRVESAYELTL